MERIDRGERVRIENLAVGVSSLAESKDRVLEVPIGTHRVQHLRQLVLDNVECFLLVGQNQDVAAGEDRLEYDRHDRMALAATRRAFNREETTLAAS